MSKKNNACHAVSPSSGKWTAADPHTHARLTHLQKGYHNNRLEGQVVTQKRCAALSRLVSEGKSADEICTSIVSHYSAKSSKSDSETPHILPPHPKK